MPLHGPVHLLGVQRERQRHPLHPRQGRRSDAALRFRHQGPPLQGTGPGAGSTAARRPVPDPGGRAVQHRPGDRPHPGAQQDPRVPAQGPLRSLLLLPGLRAARRVFHRDAPEDPAGPDGAPAGERLRVLDLLLRVSAGPRAVHPPRRPEVAHRHRPGAPGGRSDPGLPFLAGRLQQPGGGKPRRGQGHQRPGRLPERLPGRLPRALRPALRGGRPAAPAQPLRAAPAGDELLPAAGAGRAATALQAVPRRHPAGPVRRPADPGEPRPARARRIPLPPAPPERPRILDPRLRLHLRRRAGRGHPAAQRDPPGRLRPHRQRRRRERRLQPPGADRQPAVARRRPAACLRALPEADPPGLRPRLHRQCAECPHRHRPRAGAAVQDPLLPGAQTHRGRPGRQATEAGAGDPRCPRRSPGAQRGPHPAALPRPDQGDPADQLLPARRQRPEQELLQLQVQPEGHSGAAQAGAQVRDLRLLAARRGRAPARRQGGSRRLALVGPRGRLPHRGARPGQGPAGEERGDRAGRRQGRLRPAPPAAWR
ncbi:Uncharacterised protein [Klebsiella pneumoniae]|nr:Uncharacterised protein [Klebsiella pneumoniae]